MSKPKAVVLLSGGLDSTVTLAIASQDYNCTCLSFHYGQRHADPELSCAAWQAKFWEADHTLRHLDMGKVKKSALTNMDLDVPTERSVAEMEQSIPITYVPARNTILLANAIQVAEEIDANAIFIGVNAVDYSGYPDCRPEYIEAYQALLDLATKNTVEGEKITIYAPLIHSTKIQIVEKGRDLGVDFAKTCSCYQAKTQVKERKSYLSKKFGLTPFKVIECGECDSCILRNNAFAELRGSDGE